MEIVAWVVVLLVPVIGWCWTMLDRAWVRRELTQARLDLQEARWQEAKSYKTGYHDALEQSTGLLATTLTTTVADVTKALVGEMIGEVGTENTIKPQTDQTPEPSWYQWEDDTVPVEQIGAGDSVYVPRDFDDRVAGIDDGESIIPGVPLPDMSGENA